MPDLTPEKLAELQRLLAEAPPLPYRDSPATHGDPSNGPTYVALEAQWEGRWEEVATGNYEKWCGMGIALAAAAVNALPALLDAAAERDALAAKLDAVRALHGPRVVQVLGATCSAEECDHEDACPLVDYAVCGHCYDVGDGAHPYAYEDGGLQDVAHPCATYRALDATPETGCES